MKRYALTLTVILVSSLLLISVASAAVIFPPTWPSKEMPQEKPPILTPSLGHFNPPLLDVPPADPQPRWHQNYGWVARAFILCTGACYDEDGFFQWSRFDTVEKNGNFCYESYRDAKQESDALLEQAISECRQKLADQCRGSMRYDVGVGGDLKISLPRQCKHEATAVPQEGN